MAKKTVSRPPHKAPAKAKEERGGRRQGGGRNEFDNTNRGALFPNDKDGNEKRPDHTGVVDLKIPEGAKPGQVIKFRLAGWERDDRNGNPYLSLLIEKADKQGNGSKSKGRDDEEDESESDEE